MYSLYDVYSYTKGTIVKSLGQEYSTLDITNLRILLMSNLSSYKLLDGDSTNIINNSSISSLMTKSQQELIELLELSSSNNYNVGSMYELDLILLVLLNANVEYNAQSSIMNLLKSSSSNYVYQMFNVEVLPSDIMNNIVLQTTNLNSLISTII